MRTTASVERFCRYHPDRDGVGVCRRCQAVLCVDCSTKIDGINYCRNCLTAQQQSVATRPVLNRPSERSAAWALLPLLWIGTVLAVLFGGWLASRFVSM